MTEIDWLTATDPTPMLAFLEPRASERKARLFALWCCRQCEVVLRERRFQAALRLAEQLCETGHVPEADRLAAVGAVWHARDDLDVTDDNLHMKIPARLLGRTYTFRDAIYDSEELARSAEYYERNADSFDGLADELRAEQADCLRELFGNPFRPVVFQMSWLTPTVTGIARGINDDRTFDDMPILADALDDARCDDATVLRHCREGGPHTRGCWVIDTILGRHC